MFKKILKGLGIASAVLAVCIVLYFSFAAALFSSLYSEELIGKYPSADEKHCIYVYIGDGGAISSWAVICDVKGSHILGKRRIYAKDDIDTAAVTWLDDRTVEINGITLDIYEDKYPDPG